MSCPECGRSDDDDLTASLFAVCDVLVVKAMETLGKWVVRVGGRQRFHELAGPPLTPLHLAHTLWAPSEAEVNKALRGAWDVVPAMLDNHGCCGVTSGQVTATLDSYVHDLAITGTAHSLSLLSYRFESRLDICVREVRSNRWSSARI